MSEETKCVINIILDMLRTALVEQGVSIGTTKENLLFFDTATYLEYNKMVGFSVKIEDLVK